MKTPLPSHERTEFPGGRIVDTPSSGGSVFAIRAPDIVVRKSVAGEQQHVQQPRFARFDGGRVRTG